MFWAAIVALFLAIILFCSSMILLLESMARYIRDNRAFYSLDAGDGIEADALNLPEQPDEALERMELERLLKEALAQLTETQRRRLLASVLNDESNQRIAKRESVDESAVRRSIQRGLASLKKILKKS